MNTAEPLFLTTEEIKDLTGRSHAKKQIDVLRKNRIPFHLNAAGHPKVTREALLGKTKHQPEPKPIWQPSILTNQT